MAGPTLVSHLSRTLVGILEDGGTWISGRSVTQWSGMRSKNGCVQGTQTCHPPQANQPSVGDHGAARSVLIADSPGFSPWLFRCSGRLFSKIHRKSLDLSGLLLVNRMDSLPP